MIRAAVSRKSIPRLGKVGAFVMTLAVAVAACSCRAADSPCLRTNERLTLRGVVDHKRVFGPPNFGENPATDERRTIAVLRLTEPIDICPGTESEVDTAPIDGVAEVQLVNFPQGFPPGEVALSGVLARAENAFHYTAVFLVADQEGR